MVNNSPDSNILYYENHELELLKNAMNIEAKKRGERIAQNPVMKEIIGVLEKFIRDKKLVCYGGTAINNILPESEQFYNRNLEIPDYDFFSSNAINDAKELADIYFRQGFSDVEAKAGVHYGTYKVFVNFFQIADITQLDSKLFSSLKKNALAKDKILYAPPNFLRMAMYLELSRPSGDISRWEKVFKRLNLLNRHYPLKAVNCDPDTFKHSLSARSYNKQFHYEKEKIQTTIKNVASKEKLVFIGGYANVLYSRYLHNNERKYLEEIPDFDLLSNWPDKTAKAIKEALEQQDIRNITIETKAAIPEYLSTHYEVRVGSQPVAYVYKPLACHSYNSIKVNGKIFRVATIDTMMSFYLLFLYAERPYYNPRRTLCLCEYLFKIQQKNRLKQTGLLRRFSVTCYGKQKTLEDIRNDKAKQYKRLKTKKKSKEYNRWFLRYNPELNPENRPYIKQDKTEEDIINEAKLALEAKVLTSKAIINGIEGIEGLDKLKMSKKRKTATPSPITPMKTPSASRMKKLRNNTLRMSASSRLSRTRKNREVENLLFVEDDIIP